jgi:hypothetical protein
MVSIRYVEELDLNCHYLSITIARSRDFIIHCSNTILHEQYPLPALHEYSFHLQYNPHLRNVK